MEDPNSNIEADIVDKFNLGAAFMKQCGIVLDFKENVVWVNRDNTTHARCICIRYASDSRKVPINSFIYGIHIKGRDYGFFCWLPCGSLVLSANLEIEKDSIRNDMVRCKINTRKAKSIRQSSNRLLLTKRDRNGTTTSNTTI